MDKITPQEARGLRLKTDFWFLERVVKDMPGAFAFEPVKISGQKLKAFLQEQLSPSVVLHSFDKDYWFITWDEWVNILEKAYGWLDRQKYKVDRFDCDNFAKLFSAFSALALQVNTASTTRGEYFYTNGQRISGHLWNGIVTHANQEEMRLYWVEPQSLRWKEHEKGQKRWQLGHRLYEPTWMEFF